MTSDELRAAGEALYGHQWQTAMARDLGVAARSVRRWVAGSLPVPRPIELALHGMALERRACAKGERRA